MDLLILTAAAVGSLYIGVRMGKTMAYERIRLHMSEILLSCQPGAHDETRARARFLCDQLEGKVSMKARFLPVRSSTPPPPPYDREAEGSS